MRLQSRSESIAQGWIQRGLRTSLVRFKQVGHKNIIQAVSIHMWLMVHGILKDFMKTETDD
jgi:hypothetical protein